VSLSDDVIGCRPEEHEVSRAAPVHTHDDQVALPTVILKPAAKVGETQAKSVGAAATAPQSRMGY
jgi:hypothetical protein